MLKSVIIAVLFVPSILTALSREEMASALVVARDTESLEETFKTFEREQDHDVLFLALNDVAEVQARMSKVVTCLRVAHDPLPKDRMCVGYLVHGALTKISYSTDTESVANVITSFKPSDIKPLVSIRFWTLWRHDVLNVLKSVMTKYPELITDDLPSWIALHPLDQNSLSINKTALEEAFKYLTSFATEDVLEEALSIVKRNEHCTVNSRVMCCSSQDHVPQNLAGRIKALLKLVKARNVLIREALTFLPTVLIDLMLDYAPN